MLPSRTAVTMPPVPTTGPGRSTKRVLGAGRSLLAAALCAQVAHVVLYGSIFPTAGAHEYFRWYIPLVAVLSLCGLALVPVSIAASVLTRGRISSTALLPECAPGDAPNAIARLALSSAAFLLLQESIERTAVSGSIQTVTFSPLALLVAGIVLVVAAAAVVALERTLDTLAGRPQPCARPRGSVSARWVARTLRVARRRPESVHGGLRAPPLAA